MSWKNVVSLLLSLLFSDTFRKLVEMALEAIGKQTVRVDLSDSEKRWQAIEQVRKDASAAGLPFGDWLAGYAVETALAVDSPSRLRGLDKEPEEKEG